MLISITWFYTYIVFDIVSLRVSKDIFRENTFTIYISEFRKHDMRRNYVGIEPEFDSFSKTTRPHVKTKNWTLENVKTMQGKCFCKLDT